MTSISTISSSYSPDSPQSVVAELNTKVLSNCNLPYQNDPYFANRYVKMTYSQCQELASQLADLSIRWGNQIGSARHRLAEKQLINQYFATINI